MTDTQTVADKPSPMTGSERVRRTRERRRDGIMFIGIELLPTERDALIRRGLLAKVDRDDKMSVLASLYAFFERHLAEPPKPWSVTDQWHSNGSR
jgi:hypothetical protein